MRKIIQNISLAAVLAIGLGGAAVGWAQTSLETVKANISRNWAQNMPSIPPVRDVHPTSISGLYEVQVGDSEIIYTDSTGNYVLQGDLLDLPNRRNLTEERINVLTAIDFSKLPLQDAIVIKRGTGERKLVVFEDPNCGPCHSFEKQLQAVNNVTVYVFLYPILSQDSSVKSLNIWCAQDRAKTWQSWMVSMVAPGNASCEGAAGVLERNVALGGHYRITGTPTLVFADGSRISGVPQISVVEQRLNAARAR